MAVEVQASDTHATSDRRSAVLAGAVVAANTLTAAFLLGLAGTVSAWGYDGLAFVLGLGAGFSLLQLLIAPRLAAARSPTLWGYLNERYRCRVLRVFAAGVIALCSTLLLVALLLAAGIICARLLGVDLSVGIGVGAVASLTCYAVLSAGLARSLSAWAFLLLGLLLLLLAAVLSAQLYGLPLPQLAFANALWQVQGIEEALLEQDLADPAVMKPLLAPFLTLDPLSFAGIVLGLATGVAAWPAASPYLVRRAPVAAQRVALWGLVISALLLTLAPALAAYIRLMLVALVENQTRAANLPQWVFDYGALGLAEVCGRPAADAASAMAACADLPDAAPVLRVQDLAINSDVLTLSLPEMAGLGWGANFALALAGLIASVLTAQGVLAAGVDAVLGAARGRETAVSTSPLPAHAVGAVLIAAAAAGAMLHLATIVETATLALVLAAAALFPALAGGLWWQRANAVGAVASLVVGFALALVYLIGTRYFPVPFYELSSALSASGDYGYEYFTELKEAWSMTEGAEKQAAWIALEQHARNIANWWGIAPLGVALISLPAGFVALVVGALLAGRRGSVTRP
jgi:cation/acetate symporter